MGKGLIGMVGALALACGGGAPSQESYTQEKSVIPQLAHYDDLVAHITKRLPEGHARNALLDGLSAEPYGRVLYYGLTVYPLHPDDRTEGHRIFVDYLVVSLDGPASDIVNKSDFRDELARRSDVFRSSRHVSDEDLFTVVHELAPTKSTWRDAVTDDYPDNVEGYGGASLYTVDFEYPTNQWNFSGPWEKIRGVFPQNN
jgi:hypothetical protein